MKKYKIFAMLAGAIMTLGLSGCGEAGGGSSTPSYYPTEEEFSQVAEVMSPVLTDAQFYIDGQIFAFPLTVSNFTENGWQVDKDVLAQYDPFPAGLTLTGEVALIKDGEKNDMEIGVVLHNGKEEKVSIGETFVNTIYFDRYNKVKMILPGGISWGSTIEDVETAYGEADAKAETGSEETFLKTILRYMYEDGTEYAQFTFESCDGEPYKLMGVRLED